jgi:acetate kinase
MTATGNIILTLNGGSSSIKFAWYDTGSMHCLLQGTVDGIGTKSATLHYKAGGRQETIPLSSSDYTAAVEYLTGWLEKQQGFSAVKAIGHRIVHGMTHTEPEAITPVLLDALKQIIAYDPSHLPGEIQLIEALGRRFPSLPQVACFDTAFHTTMPRVAKLLPIPRRFDDKGIRRYGFHGISYAYIMEELARIAGAGTANGRVVIAHLGNGASMAAVKEGKSVDTSMGFTPTAGLPMGTRTGDLDPGVAWYIMQNEKLTPNQFNHLVNHDSGLLGVSTTSADMRVLLQAAVSDQRAAEAVDLFCYQAKKWIGAFAAALGGVDTIVFTGGIGEHAAAVRARICNGLEFLGVTLDDSRNDGHEAIISTDAAQVVVRVIPTNEELMIAKTTSRILHFST